MKLLYGQVEYQDSFHSVISNELKDIGIKVPKVAKPSCGNHHVSASVFGRCISQLPHESVPQNGFMLQVPRFLVMATTVIRQNLKAEGLFRKGGSIQRQKELKLSLENGGDLENANVHDVANLVKQFLRGLSEPLLQPRLYESFIKAYDLGDAAARRKAIFLLCALLPTEHLHVLRFMMAFFAEITSYTAHNKMDSNCLAIVLMPNLFILPEELDRKDKSKEKLLQKQTGLVKFLIDNYGEIGSVSDHVLDRAKATSNLLTHSDDDLDGTREARAKLTAKKKRNSMNVFHGLRKMVQQNRIPSVCNDDVDVSDGSLIERTPSQATKRKLVGDKAAAQCSSAKKRSMMQLKSEKLQPIPMTHLDSPAPVQSENEVFSSPAHFLGRNNDGDLRKRKSGRMKFFGKAYLARRNSTSRSPKQIKKPEKESLSTSKKQVVGRHLKGNDYLELSPAHLSAPQPQSSPTSYRSILNTTGKGREPASVCQLNNRVSFDKRLTLEKSPVAPPKASTSGVSLGLGNSLQSGAAKWYAATSNSGRRVSKLDSAHRSRSFVIDPASSVPSDQCASPVRNVIWRPLTKSSLRRGRPNTIRAGLPTPSKTNATNGMVHYTSDPGPMVENGRTTLVRVAVDSPRLGAKISRSEAAKIAAVTGVQKVLVFSKEERDDGDGDEFGSGAEIQKVKIVVCNPSSKSKAARNAAKRREKEAVESRHRHLPKSDSGMFESSDVSSGVESTVMEVSGMVKQSSPAKMGSCSPLKTMHKSPSLDSGISHGESDSASVTGMHGVPSLSTKSHGLEKQSEAAVMCELPPPLHSHVLSTPRKAATNTEWRSAVDVFRGNAGNLEEAAAGRPSLLRLMKDKAGSVTAAARKYDEIAIRSKTTERPLSMRSASPLVRARVLQHKRSVSRDETTAVPTRSRLPSGGTTSGRTVESKKSKTSALESKENMPQGSCSERGFAKDGSAVKATAARRAAAGTSTARVVLTPSSSQNVPRRLSASVGRSKSDGRSPANLVRGSTASVIRSKSDGRSPANVVRGPTTSVGRSPANVERGTTVSIGRSKSDGRSPVKTTRKSPRLQTRAKLNLARSRRSSNHQRRSTSM